MWNLLKRMANTKVALFALQDEILNFIHKLDKIFKRILFQIVLLSQNKSKYYK